MCFTRQLVPCNIICLNYSIISSTLLVYSLFFRKNTHKSIDNICEENIFKVDENGMVWGLSILGDRRWDLDPLWYMIPSVELGTGKNRNGSLILRWTIIPIRTYSISKSWTFVYPATQQLHSQVQPWEKCIHIFMERHALR